MATTPEDGIDDTLVATARRVVADTSTLLRAEASLARMETEANARAAAGVAARLAIGIGLLVIAVLFALMAGLVALALAFGWIESLLGLALLLAVAGGLLVVGGRRDARGLTLLPERTLGRMAGDLRAMSNAAERARPGEGQRA